MSSALAVFAEDQLIVPPPGNVRFVDCVLKGAGDKGADIWLRAATRTDRIPVPSNLSVREIVSELKLEGASLTGEYRFWAPACPSFSGSINATVAPDGAVTGTWTRPDKSTGALVGRLKTEAELRQENAFASKADWPCWNGPFTSMAATPTGVALVEDFGKDGRLVWRSEELVPQGPGNSLNYEKLALTDSSNGGGASLIVYDGKVFVSYYQPAGTNLMAGPVYERGQPPRSVDEFLALKTKERGLAISPFMREKWLVKADDVVVCMDAVTGKTLWKNVFAEKSLNQPSHKGGCVNNTPCAGGGKVFAMGPSGCVRGMDIATGKVLWERTGMSAEPVKPWSGARNQCTAPVYIGGVLVLPDHGTTLTGLDPETGKDLWKLGKGSPFAVPSKWVHQGQEYVISLTSGGYNKKFDIYDGRKIACIEAKTGRILWELDITTLPGKGLSVYGDVAYLTSWWYDRENPTNKERKAICTAYRLGLDKAEKIWETPVPKALGDPLPACNGSVVVVQGLEESYLLDPASGKVLAGYAGTTGMTEAHAAIMEDKVLMSRDGAHGASDMAILGATPETFPKLFCSWSQPHPQTTSYHNKFMTWPMVEGRIFMRGADGVYCYDLRKRVALRFSARPN